MTDVEIVQHSFAENVATVDRGLANFIEVGQALMEIRDRRQYIEAGFDTFEDFCRERWDLSRSYADNKIGSAQVANEIMRSHESGRYPQSEWIARPLVKVLHQGGEDAVHEAWSQIVEKHESEGPITGREVRRFFTLGGATYGRPGWFEMLGEVAMSLERADKQLARLEEAITRKPSAAFREQAGDYVELAEDCARRLRHLAE